jgi:hypothetical protein
MAYPYILSNECIFLSNMDTSNEDQQIHCAGLEIFSTVSHNDTIRAA